MKSDSVFSLKKGWPLGSISRYNHCEKNMEDRSAKGRKQKSILTKTLKKQTCLTFDKRR